MISSRLQPRAASRRAGSTSSRRAQPSPSGWLALTAVIEDIHDWSRGTYGVPRMTVELEARGHHVDPKRVARLMREAGLQTGQTRSP